jgi:CRISPR-associated endonuclease/helicase Cas3
MLGMTNFEEFFVGLTGRTAYPYQTRLAGRQVCDLAIQAPTGAGKTAAVILAWLFRRLVDASNTPRRLVYCLPMRVLVEQTRRCAIEWVGKAAQFGVAADVYTLMGGEVEEDWETQAERQAILIGTQDMLLSRALNRGYAMNRYQWPVHFGLLNNDALWVCDEVQLMGSGLATTSQLVAWRGQFRSYGPSATWWMSATMNRDWLATVDFAHRAADLSVAGLNEEDRDHPEIQLRWTASKPLERMGPVAERPLVRRILKEHQPGSLTLVIVNTVDRAQKLYEELRKRVKATPSNDPPELVLAHSRFRGYERQQIGRRLETAVPESGPGRIVVATQVVEAGVDISARTLFTELAPWASMVQRFGRANRYGEFTAATVFWVDLPPNKAKPYNEAALAESREKLGILTDAALAHLDALGPGRFEPPLNVVRRKDLVELFDTTPDLGGADVDVSRFVRDGEDLDAQLFWRDLKQEPPSDDEPLPAKEELCPVPFHEAREFFKEGQRAYRWNPLDGRWEGARQVLPGQAYLIPAESGGYTPEVGWNSKASEKVTAVVARVEPPESYRSDPLSRGAWLTVAEHTDHVVKEVADLARALSLDDATTALLETAARWHDRGKGHPVFQAAVPGDETHPPGCWAKGAGRFHRYRRPQFRHELASALAVLQEESGLIPDKSRDLIAYLAASHHGKVRLSIRSLPREIVPPDGQRFARGIWEGDVLPELDLGGGVVAPEARLTLEPMEVGLGANGQPSWAERTTGLRDDPEWGVFRLAYLETLLRAADRRASAKETGDG